MTDPKIRPATREDAALLATATLGNVNWCGERFSAQDIETRPEFAHYTALLPDRGDFGFIAERDGRPVGVGWAVLLPPSDPGYGFVDATTPEVSLWVSEHARGEGVGRRLLGELQEEARRRSVRLSLSVEDGNHARALYEHAGFVAVPGGEADGIMLWEG